jgi:hypothetical protein
MKPAIGMFLACFSLALSIQARSTTLPDACGSDKVQFDVKTEKNQPPPSAPQAGKAQIVFVGQVDSTAEGRCIGCNAISTTRVGMDGNWLGATKGGSYFAVDVDPGEHHLCAYWKSISAARGKNIVATSFNAAAGTTYYYQVTIKDIEAPGSGASTAPVWVLHFAPLNEDEGKYQVKISALATSTQKK